MRTKRALPAVELGILGLTFFVLSLQYSWTDYCLYRDYQKIIRILPTLTSEQFEQMQEKFHDKPRLLCRILEKGFQDVKLENSAHNLSAQMIKERFGYTPSERLDLLSTIDKAKALDPVYEEWIVEEGLFYLPQDLYFLSRKYLLNYEMSSGTELTPYERSQALAFLENMLRSEERSS